MLQSNIKTKEGYSDPTKKSQHLRPAKKSWLQIITILPVSIITGIAFVGHGGRDKKLKYNTISGAKDGTQCTNFNDSGNAIFSISTISADLYYWTI